jgi:hypothetical protein
MLLMLIKVLFCGGIFSSSVNFFHADTGDGTQRNLISFPLSCRSSILIICIKKGCNEYVPWE